VPASVGDVSAVLPDVGAVSQSRAWSAIEAWVNVCVGFAVNYAANLVVLPLFGFHVKPGQALGIGGVFTVISLARSYALRRAFNGVGQSAKLRPANSLPVPLSPDSDSA
jgi:hypothetical protein